MSIEEMIHAWKANEEALEPIPVGRELSEQDLLEVFGGVELYVPYCSFRQGTSSPCRTSPSTDTTAP